MSKEIVKYNNELNMLPFKSFTEYDLNFFMAICAKMRDLGEEVQVFEYSKMMELLDWDTSKSIDVFHRDLMRLGEKLRHIGGTLVSDDGDTFISFNLFTHFKGCRQKRTFEVGIDPKFKYILNDLSNNFTKFELSEYVKLDGKYSKLLYQNLKQYRKSGWWQVSVNDLRGFLSIPNTLTTMHIATKILKPSIEVIKLCKGFGELEFEVLRSKERGRKVTGYKFTWTAEKQIPGQMNISDYDGSGKEKKKNKSKYQNFEQREYDFDELEKILTNN